MWIRTPLIPKYTLAKIVLKLLSVSVRTIVFLTFLFVWSLSLSAQDVTNNDSLGIYKKEAVNDTLRFPISNSDRFKDTLSIPDTLPFADSLQADSLVADSIIKPQKPKSAFDSEVVYSAD